MGITAKNIIDYAISQIGTKENPAGSNKVKYNTWYYGKEVSGSAYPWCAVFVSYVFNKCNAISLFCGGSKSAYCPSIENYYKSIGAYHSNKNGKPGDLCIMDFGKGRASHIGIVEKKNTDGTYTVIEGNTSTSSNDNGGCVMRRIRSTSVIRGFCRPKYDTDNTIQTTIKYSKNQFIKDVQSAIGAKVDGIVGKETLSKTITVSKTKNNRHAVVKPIQEYLNTLGFSCGNPDGIAGTKFDAAVKAYQRANGCVADGIVGKNTWKKLLGL